MEALAPITSIPVVNVLWLGLGYECPQNGSTYYLIIKISLIISPSQVAAGCFFI